LKLIVTTVNCPAQHTVRVQLEHLYSIPNSVPQTLTVDLNLEYYMEG